MTGEDDPDLVARLTATRLDDIEQTRVLSTALAGVLDQAKQAAQPAILLDALLMNITGIILLCHEDPDDRRDLAILLAARLVGRLARLEAQEDPEQPAGDAT